MNAIAPWLGTNWTTPAESHCSTQVPLMEVLGGQGGYVSPEMDWDQWFFHYWETGWSLGGNKSVNGPDTSRLKTEVYRHLVTQCATGC